tara:strand:+ start:2784 stop:2954 length:171 start_codon:yes stop_codon:yes gene_type:complete
MPENEEIKSILPAKDFEDGVEGYSNCPNCGGTLFEGASCSNPECIGIVSGINEIDN